MCVSVSVYGVVSFSLELFGMFSGRFRSSSNSKTSSRRRVSSRTSGSLGLSRSALSSNGGEDCTTTFGRRRTSSSLLSAGSQSIRKGSYGSRSKRKTNISKPNRRMVEERLNELSLDGATGRRRSHPVRAGRSFRSSYPTLSSDDEDKSPGDRGAGSSGAGSKLCCDKCDGKHETSTCPHYRKKRGKHPDEQKGKGRSIGGGGGNFTLKNARVVRQPGDGSCLFHSLSYGLGSGNARSVRREIASFIAKNPDLEIADSPMKDWIMWESGSSVSSYARRMSTGGWGGGIEMAAFSLLKGVNVHVYESRGFMRGGYRRISCFNAGSGRGGKTVHVLYGGRVHYDALVPR